MKLRSLFAKFCLLAFATPLYAQSGNLHWGLSLPLSARFNLRNGENSLQRALGTWGISGLLMVDGQNEENMSLQMAVGIVEDIRPFRLDVNSVFSARLYYININPTILIPTKRPDTHITMGIGCLLNIGHITSFRTNGNAPMYYMTNVDSAAQNLIRNCRGVLPYIALGIRHYINKKIALQATIEPTLTDYYQPGTHVFYETPYAQHDFEMAYQPIFFSLKLQYTFSSKSW